MHIDCKKLANRIKEEIKNRDEMYYAYGQPNLVIVQVGDSSASNSYIKGKMNDCNEVDICYTYLKYKEDVEEDGLIKELRSLQEDCDGIIVQLPLPKHIDEKRIIAMIDKDKDVDGFKIDSPFEPCTPLGVVAVLEEVTSLAGKDVLIINRSNIVGKPLAKLLIDKDATVTIAHSRTKDLRTKIRQADIVITAVGKPNFIKKDDVREGQIIIDISINRGEDGRLCGDVERGCEEIADVTPVPGGIGLMTRAMLMWNTWNSFKKKVDEMEDNL